jgi:hypothetical protein
MTQDLRKWMTSEGSEMPEYSAASMGKSIRTAAGVIRRPHIELELEFNIPLNGRI